MDEIEQLRKENQRLRAKLTEAKNKIISLQQQIETHSTMATGMQGEKHILDCIPATATIRNGIYDLLTHDGQRVEVKTSKLVDAGEGHMRWQWGKVTGQSEDKDYDRIFLIGILPPDAPKRYQIFDVPFDVVKELETEGGKAAKQIRASVKFTSKCGSRRKLLEHFSVTEEELKARYQSS